MRKRERKRRMKGEEGKEYEERGKEEEEDGKRGKD